MLSPLLTAGYISDDIFNSLIKGVIAEKPWEFFEHTDLLDFPGARSRSKLIELPSETAERE